jgi:hypothetical protein
MALNSKIIVGLAWVGLAVVLAIPSADIVSSQLSPKDTLAIASDTDQIRTASIADPVERFEQTGQPLPSYVSVPAATETAVVTPKPTVKIVAPSGSPQSPAVVTMPTTPTATPAETEVAAIAPVPYPVSMRPKAPITVAPMIDEPVVVDEEPVIVDEQEVAALPEVDQPPVRRPPAAVEEPRYITEDELDGWNSGNLADYLAEQGLLEGSNNRPASTAQYDAEYDPDGFFLDEGPNNRNNRSFRSRSRRNNDGGFFVVFPD